MIIHHLPSRAPAFEPSPGAAAAATDGDTLSHRFSVLYALAQDSRHLFGSPLGPFTVRGENHVLPRFVYFGPDSSDDSVRLAILAGFDGSDSRPTEALVHFIEKLAVVPDLGQGLHLSLFPVVNPSGIAHRTRSNAAGIDLTAEHWDDSVQPEVALLRQDARLRGYHGFVRIESAAVAEVTGVVRRVGRASVSLTDVDLVAADQTDRFPVRWERHFSDRPPQQGPLSIADDFAIGPFELILRIPNVWDAPLYREAVAQVLRHFIVRYRATLSYGLNL
jgi:hypothetical protein